jgi:CBS domain-containing protein
LNSLFKKGIIQKNSFDEIVQAYNYLMQIRFIHQTNQIAQNKLIDNFINPEELTQIDIKTLKNTFSQINGIQKRLSYDFTGEAL